MLPKLQSIILRTIGGIVLILSLVNLAYPILGYSIFEQRVWSTFAFVCGLHCLIWPWQKHGRRGVTVLFILLAAVAAMLLLLLTIRNPDWNTFF